MPTREHPLSSTSDDELLRRLAELVRDSRHAEVELLRHLAEVDAQRLYAREACPRSTGGEAQRVAVGVLEPGHLVPSGDVQMPSSSCCMPG